MEQNNVLEQSVATLQHKVIEQSSTSSYSNKVQRLLELESQRSNTIRIAVETRKLIERTKTNKELEKLETEYLVRFKTIFTKIILEYKHKEYLLYEARNKYGESIHTLIKSMVTRVYFLGMEYVGRAINKPYIITFEKADEQKIVEQTKDAEDIFWCLHFVLTSVWFRSF
jgi:hypothetical protein